MSRRKIRCPKCRRPLFVMCLTSYPAKYECACNSCGFNLRYFDREDNHKQITQEEVDTYYEQFRWKSFEECKDNA